MIDNQNSAASVKHLSRIVWAEGMYLGPHHFQAQSRYFEDAVHFAADSLWFSPFGFAGCELDEAALANGVLKLNHARGIFADGLAFDMPACDPLPDTRQIEPIFLATAKELDIYLAVPVQKASGGNCALDPKDAKATRYSAEERTVADEISGGDEKRVRFGRKNICLLSRAECGEAWQTLQVARVKRAGTNHFVLDKEFIPPVLKISASKTLLDMTERLIDILGQKNTAFTGATKGFAKQASGMSAQQVQTFWFLHTINSGIAGLRHLYKAKRSHPEELYNELLRLGGSLCTFGLDSSAAELPLYDHLNLQGCFQALDQHIRDHLELVVPTNCLAIRLQRVDDYFWEGEITDTRMLGNARWYLAVNAKMGEAELITGTPLLVKVCSSSFVRELVKRAMPGMKLTHVSVPPAALNPKITYQYFTINRGGPCWDHILVSKKVGVYVPGELSSAQLELLVLLDS